MSRPKWRATFSEKIHQLVTLIGLEIRDPLPEVRHEDARAVVVSFYKYNVPTSVIAAQRRLLKRLVPADVAIKQLRMGRKHAKALTRFAQNSQYPVTIFLDIDCVPTDAGAIDRLISLAKAGLLAGVAQRANHLENGKHIYVSPVCMAFTSETFASLQPVSFAMTSRGDVGEELTYVAEERGLPVKLLWPVDSEDKIWELTDGIRYGHGTTYEGGFWHAFEIRSRDQHARFIERCREIELALDGGGRPV